jgi:methionyl-tRNA formyltransferase
MPKPLNVLVVAEESAGIRVLRALAGGGHRVTAVVTSDSARGPASSVRDAARQMGYDTWPAGDVKHPSFGDRIRSADVDILLNVHSLYVLSEEVVSAPRIGSFNLHPGPLPRYAGLNAPSWAIYRGEAMHGVTVHRRSGGIDAGPIVFQSTFAISDRDTGLSVALRCVTEGVPLLLRLLEIAATAPEDIPQRPQDLGEREYFGKGVPQNGVVDWSRSAREVWNFVRACDYAPFVSPWGCPRTTSDGREVGILKLTRTGEPCAVPSGSIRANSGSGMLVACADKWVEVTKIVLDGRVLSPVGVLQPGSRLHVGDG